MSWNDLKIGRATNPGAGGRLNEDSESLQTLDYRGEKVTLAVVADGIGGREGGQLASETATRAISQYFAEHGSANVHRNLEQAIHFANTKIFERAQSLPPAKRSGTTVTAAAIANDKLHIANVGDSRVYLLRDGQLHQLSTDHTWAQEAIKARRLSPEQAKVHPNRHVLTRSLGTGAKIEVDTSFNWEESNPATLQQQGLPLKQGDILLLCTDGLNDVVSDDDIQKVLSHMIDPQRAADKLVSLVLERGGADNVTLQVIHVSGGEKPVAMAIRSLGYKVPAGFLLLVIAVASLFILTRNRVGNSAAFTATPTEGTRIESGTTTAIATPTVAQAAPSASPTEAGPVTPTLQPTNKPTPTLVPTNTNTPTKRPPPTSTDTPTNMPIPTRPPTEPPQPPAPPQPTAPPPRPQPTSPPTREG